MQPKLNLSLMAGGYRVSKAKVACVKTPKPTESWKPLPHIELIKTLEASLKKVKIDVVHSVHALQGDKGERYFGMFQTVDAKHRGNDLGQVIGLRNAHDKRLPAGLVAGTGVFVCDNLCFSGEVKLGRKHTTHIERDLPGMIFDALGKLYHAYYVHRARIDHYREVELKQMEVNDLVVTAMEREIIPVTRIPYVLQEWKEPSCEEWTEEPKTVWRLHNAFTADMKGSSPFSLPAVTQKLNALLDESTMFEPEEIAA